ncbi:GFA family protein [Pelomonas sp. APW6]|uniref:GFA family protein n=1 Tax=Roseateles subflavus TaxID=3053353 RepID=A0ABT7LD41_9BURK|nr:GFA family protein [Pelomonas sp. APW6]MDL5030768.1 GFA family protein [Pelomonas sp. APW6]
MRQDLTPSSRRGGCHCGAVTLRVAEPLQAPIHCHCGLCRRLSGAAFTTWLSLPVEALDVQGAEQLRAYRPTVHLERLFCSQCGTHVMTRDARHGHITGVPAGVMPAGDVPPASGEYFVSHKASWQPLSADVPCFGGETGFELVPRPAA